MLGSSVSDQHFLHAAELTEALVNQRAKDGEQSLLSRELCRATPTHVGIDVQVRGNRWRRNVPPKIVVR